MSCKLQNHCPPKPGLQEAVAQTHRTLCVRLHISAFRGRYRQAATCLSETPTRCSAISWDSMQLESESPWRSSFLRSLVQPKAAVQSGCITAFFMASNLDGLDQSRSHVLHRLAASQHFVSNESPGEKAAAVAKFRLSVRSRFLSQPGK